MPAIDLSTPILNSGQRTVNFFNGRLVSANDMTDEQTAHRASHQLLGRITGDGVASGLEVAQSDFGSTANAPMLTVKQGVAVNRRGEVLVLPADTEVRLVRPKVATSSAAPNVVFHTCTPPQETPPLVDAAVYLLTICSSRSGEGTTPFGGLSGVQSRCNMRWVVDSVEFRLVQVNLANDLRNDTNRLRNRIAYACFGTAARFQYGDDPFGSAHLRATLLDALRREQITDCDVPLAILQWKTTGITFIDLWSVRRSVAFGASDAASLAYSDRATSLAEAMQKQFAEQLDELRLRNDASLTQARNVFRFLPPAGFLPVSNGGTIRFEAETFFSGKAHNKPLYIEAADVEAILRESVHYPPVDLEDDEMVRLYLVHENRVAPRSTHYVLFANANLPYHANARFNRSHFSFSNFV
ncbi:MAG TPA: hypothetical protein VF787_18790 [Thermoanaerobaculia bacterium]